MANDGDDSPQSKATRAAASVAIVGVGTGLATRLNVPADVAAALSGGLAVLLDRSVEALMTGNKDRRRARWREYLRQYVQADADTPIEKIEASLRMLAEAPDLQEAVREAARGLDEALSDVVVLPLARLTRLYATSGRPADAFYRGVRRLLQELSTRAFIELVALLRAVANDGTAVQGLVRVSSNSVVFGTPNVRQILHLMKTNLLAADEKTAGFGSSHGPFIPDEEAIVEQARARQMLAIVDSSQELRWTT